MIFGKTVAMMGRELRSKYDISSTIRHKGERGRQREHGLISVLEDILPEAYGVATGEIICAYDEQCSPQCDIIIYDRLRFPILGKSSSVQQVPYESVYAVIETKSIIDRAALLDAERKFRAIRKIKRVPARLPRNADRGPHFVLFGYQLRTTVDACQRYLERDSRRRGDGMIAILGHGNGIWIEHGRVRSARTRRSFWSGDDVADTLAFFLAGLIYSLASTDLGKPNMLLTLGGP